MKSKLFLYDCGMRHRMIGVSMSMILLNPVWALKHFSHIRSFQTSEYVLDVLDLSRISYNLWAKKTEILENYTNTFNIRFNVC